MHVLNCKNVGEINKDYTTQVVGPVIQLTYIWMMTPEIDYSPPSCPSPSTSVTGQLVHDDDYWKRCCKARWKLCDVKRHGGSWKRMLFERNLQEAIEGHTPVNLEAEPKEVRLLSVGGATSG